MKRLFSKFFFPACTGLNCVTAIGLVYALFFTAYASPAIAFAAMFYSLASLMGITTILSTGTSTNGK